MLDAPISSYVAFEQVELERVCPYTGRRIWIRFALYPEESPPNYDRPPLEDMVIPCPECNRKITVDVSPPW